MESKQLPLAVSRRFFKIMLPGFHHQLKLPPVISKELENIKTQTAILHSRKGQWKINMCRNCNDDEDEDEDDDDDGLICFKQGWPQFVDSHALSLGDFLVFEHTGKLHFNVSVFDSSACEKEFLVVPKKEKEETSAEATSTHPRKRARDNDNVVAEKESLYFVKKMTPYLATKDGRVNIPVEFAKSNNLEQKTSNVILKDSGGRKWPVKLCFHECTGVLRMFNGWHDFYTSNGLKDGDVCVFKLQRNLLTSTNKLQFSVSVIKSSAREKKSRVEPKEKGETSAADTGHLRKRARSDDEIPCFVMKMAPYHATKGGRVAIPVEFARLNNLEQKTTAVVLRDSVGRKWPVKLHFDRCNRVLRMCNGWLDFYESNDIKIGDTCVFKLTHSNKLHFNVSVIKKFCVEPKKEKEETSATATGHPKKSAKDDESLCFEKEMTPYHATKEGKLNIPVEFVRSNNLEQKRSVTLRDSGGKKWPVKFLVERPKNGVGVYLRMYAGWHDFYEAKNLKDGDVCVFKLNRSLQTQTDILFDVQISPA